MRVSVKEWTAKGDPWVWLNAGAVAISLVMVLGLLLLIAVRGLSHFWPHSIMEAEYIGDDGKVSLLIGEIVESEDVPTEQLRHSGVKVPEGEGEFLERLLIKTGNRDVLGFDFRWVLAAKLRDRRYPEEIMAIERREWGNFYGYLEDVKESGNVVASGPEAWEEFQSRIDRALALHEEIYDIEKHQIGSVNYTLERLRLKERRLELEGDKSPQVMADISAERAEQDVIYQALQEKLADLYSQVNRDAITARAMNGNVIEIPLSKIVRAFQPNGMGLFEKIGFYFSKVWEFISDDPREANTEGGIFPAIFGTVLMVIIMSVMVTPLGVVAAVYLREYAHQGALTRIIRIAVNNLAGVPSIVYGVFGLGFFIYFLGSNIDDAFYPEALPSPTFGTPGLMWASITLAILTLPVVIVATEEGLARIPRSMREGSLALGATKAETLWRVVIPMASPAMMTGVILAIARAAGEVAPLMLVGVVKLAPSLPLDGNYPYLHLDQKFMHLGFHIYDVGFQSPNVEAARPLVYATALLLVAVIALLNLSAVAIRNRLREKYKALEM
ncbi:phosphate ABC transporter permease PstA [Hahella ganghwensis]|uniref:phosphate ABC transporter permease PstA n=1 Tax=Hahella ganghwensis TaxID=286420 RepID=UPI000381322F|nr:phosphate ABC transporter permease PstA [Hahella ganghwensis]